MDWRSLAEPLEQQMKLMQQQLDRLGSRIDRLQASLDATRSDLTKVALGVVAGEVVASAPIST